MEIVIEKGVPQPTVKTRKWPLEAMEVNDSFAVPEGKEKPLRSAIHHHQKVTGKKFTVRREDNGGMRCWRTK